MTEIPHFSVPAEAPTNNENSTSMLCNNCSEKGDRVTEDLHFLCRFRILN
jgi:hypothetical protein